MALLLTHMHTALCASAVPSLGCTPIHFLASRVRPDQHGQPPLYYYAPSAVCLQNCIALLSFFHLPSVISPGPLLAGGAGSCTTGSDPSGGSEGVWGTPTRPTASGSVDSGRKDPLHVHAVKIYIGLSDPSRKPDRRGASRIEVSADAGIRTDLVRPTVRATVVRENIRKLQR